MKLNSIQQNSIEREIVDMKRDIARLQRFLQAVPISGARIGDIAITDDNIDFYSWSKGMAGIAGFGGASNARGQLKTYDSAEGEAVILDKNGLVIYNGMVEIQNDDNDTVVDNLGLVSLTAFAGASDTGSGVQTTTSGTYQDITGVSVTFTLDRTAKVLLFGSVCGLYDSVSDSNTCISRLIVDSTPVGVELYTPGKNIGTDVLYQSSSITQIVELASGSHTIKSQFKSSGGVDNAEILRDGCMVGYVRLGV